MSRQIIKPNFFIIGAPKCGTTTLYTYLCMHPNVFMPDVKEPFYFCHDLIQLVDCYADYMSLFSLANESHIAIGEASSGYLASQVALQSIYQFNSDARIIAIIRNPVDHFVSFYDMRRLYGAERHSNIEVAWENHLATLPTSTTTGKTFARLNNYTLVCSTGSQLRRLVDTFQHSKRKILLLDDLVESPSRTISDLLAFLGLPEYTYPNAILANPRHEPRYPALSQFFGSRYMNWARVRFKPTLYSMFGRHSDRILHALNYCFLKKAPRASLRKSFRCQLTEYFYDEIRLIEQITNRDLSHWREG